MYPYIAFIIFFLIYSFLFHKFCKNEKYYLIISFIMLFLFVSLKNVTSAVDLDNYAVYFNLLKYEGLEYAWNNFRLEKGYILYNWIFVKLNFSYWSYLMVTSLLSLLGICKFIRNNSKNYFLSLLIFITFGFYIYYFGILRQVLAISILLYFFEFLKEKKYIKYLFVILIASLFHKSALILIPFLYFSHKPITKKSVNFTLGLVIVFYLFRVPVVNLANEILSGMYVIGSNSGGGYKMLFLLLGLYVFLVHQNKNKLFNSNGIVFTNMISLALVLQTFATIEGALARVVVYFSIAIVIIVPNWLTEHYNNKYVKWITYVMIVCLIAFYLLEVSNQGFYKEYLFFWN